MCLNSEDSKHQENDRVDGAGLIGREVYGSSRKTAVKSAPKPGPAMTFSYM